VLHDADDRSVFDSVVVITDRRVLDRQLQRTIRQFEQTSGVVENIDQTSKQLKQALEEARRSSSQRSRSSPSSPIRWGTFLGSASR